jgi:hypothetical protein
MAGERAEGHLCEFAQVLAVRGDHRAHAFLASHSRFTRFLSGEHETRREALHVPFPRTWNGLVKIIDVEHQSAVRCRIRAEVVDVCVAAQLHSEAGGRQGRQIRRHQDGSAAKERER